MRPDESFVEQPIRSLQTMLRVFAEDNAKMPTVVPDGIYGPSTMQAVSIFQRQNNLPATGTADQKTWEAIVAAYDDAIIQIGKAEPIEIVMDPGKIFHLGDRSPYIYLLQSMLTQLSFEHQTIIEPVHNGTLDDITAESLSGFQLLAGLPVTGELDKITWKHLVRQFALSAHHRSSEHST